MTKIDFNDDNYSHRLMLALAVRDYTNTPGQSASGKHEGDRKSLLMELEGAGCATSKSQIDRIVQALRPEDRGAPYPRNARQIAAFLEQRGYFPPGQDIDKTLKILPLFFDGFASGAGTLLREVAGEYHTYKYSSIDPEIILIGHLTIAPVSEWNFAKAVETIEIKHKGHNTLIYEGVAFSDEEKNLYLLMRERNHRHPRFYLFDDCDRPNGSRIEAIYGSLLGGARLRKRHITPIALHRAEHERPPGEVNRRDPAALPAPIRRYLLSGA